MRYVVALALLLHAAFAAAATLHQGQKPNVVFILADDLGYSDVGCYNAFDIHTPNIDRLRNGGMKFTDFYANAAVCTPTRAGFMTGRYQQRIGGLEWAINRDMKGVGLPAREKTIADLLRGAGYATAMSGKWHLGQEPPCRPIDHGFERFFGLLSGNHDYFTHRESNGAPDLWLQDRPIQLEGYSTDLITQYALQFMQEIKDRPFFLYVAYNAPHFPFEGPDDKGIKLEKSEWPRKGSRKTYVAMVEEMDKGIGEVLQALDRDGLAQSTLVVFASDNGGVRFSYNRPLSHAKGSVWEGGIRVPCIARLPGVIPAGSESSQVGITMDWTATIAAMAGVSAPKDKPFDGIDLLPILSGKSPQVQRTLFWRAVEHKDPRCQLAVRDGNWKYIFRKEDGQQFLYDLTKDISEKQNLAAEDPKKCAELKAKIDDWEKQVKPAI